MPYYNIDLTATARLPGLDIEVVHRRLPGGDREEISIKLQAVPSFEAFGRFLEAANPFVFWAEATRLTWLEAARTLMPSRAASTRSQRVALTSCLSRSGRRRGSVRHAISAGGVE
jgi:hypothetical protein